MDGRGCGNEMGYKGIGGMGSRGWGMGDGSHVRERIRRAEMRWRMMSKMLGYKGKVMSRECLGRLFKTVVE